jgi:hypothetical protein
MSDSPSSYQSTATLREQSDEQIAGAYLAMIANLPREKRLDAIADVLATPIEGGVRKPLLREFNNLMEKANV